MIWNDALFIRLKYLLLVLICASGLACSRSPKKVTEKLSFKKVMGIGYTEVRRAFKTGVVFNDQGFQMAPDWRLTFVFADSVNIYSPDKKRFFNCPVIFDHDSVFNIAWAWLKLRKLSKDSIIFQVLHVEDKVVSDEHSNMYMTLYANNYIKNVLHTDAQTLQRPNRKDTLYIKNKIALANKYPDSAFAATEQATLKSNSPLLTIKKPEQPVDSAASTDPRPGYINPEYNITISRAYKDFYYSFIMIIDAQGGMHFWRSTTISMDADFATAGIRMMTGIMNGYLKLYLKITPGKTLNMPHNSFVIVNVTGKAG